MACLTPGNCWSKAVDPRESLHPCDLLEALEVSLSSALWPMVLNGRSGRVFVRLLPDTYPSSSACLSASPACRRGGSCGLALEIPESFLDLPFRRRRGPNHPQYSPGYLTAKNLERRPRRLTRSQFWIWERYIHINNELHTQNPYDQCLSAKAPSSHNPI